jgi:hypothetical protein
MSKNVSVKGMNAQLTFTKIETAPPLAGLCSYTGKM